MRGKRSSEIWRDVSLAALYAGFGLGWILLSSYLVPRRMGLNAETYGRFELVKGYLFMLVSSLLFFILLRSHSKHEQKLRQEVLESENISRWNGKVLEMLAAGDSLEACLTELCKGIERQRPPALCAVMIHDGYGRLFHAAAPTLPRDFFQSADGLRIAEGAGSCGTAAFRKKMVVAGDIANDPLWKDFCAPVIAQGIRACWSSPILARDGRVLGTLGLYCPEPRTPSVRDLQAINHAVQTARVVIEHDLTRTRLRDSERVYRDLVEGAPIGVCNASNGFRSFHSVNPALARMLGYSLTQEVESIDAEREVWADSAERESSFAELLRRGFLDGLVQWKRKDGRVCIVRCLATIIERKSEAVVAQLICEDVSERREMELRTQQAARLESIGRLAGGIAHDFNNILMVTQSYAELIEPYVRNENQASRYLKEITKAGSRAAELTRQLLTFSSKQMFVPEAIDLNERIRTSLAGWTSLLGRRVRINTELGANLPYCLVDGTQLEQVLLNLLLNARDAMPDGGRVDIRTFPSGEDGQKRVCLEIADTGRGIPPEILPNIFDPFFTTKDPGKGTGLGLASVHGIVQRANGAIKVESRVGVGTTFRVYLPVTERARVQKPIPIESESDLNVRGTVMLVEDDPAILASLESVLRQRGLDVLAFGSAEDALKALNGRGSTPDLLVSDVVLPGMNGLALAEEVRRRDRSAKVLVISAFPNASEDPVSRGYTFLQKPIRLDLFCETVCRMLKEPVHNDVA